MWLNNTPTPTAKNTIVGTNLYGKITKCSDSISTIAPAKIEPVIKNKIDDAIWNPFFALIIRANVNGKIDTRNNKSKRIW